MRHFPYLGWTILAVPVDVFEFSGVARMWIGMLYGFKPDDVTELRARRLPIGKHRGIRTWWVLAIPTATLERVMAENRAAAEAEGLQEQKRSRRPQPKQKRSDG